MRVLVSAPYPVAETQELLQTTGTTVEAGTRPWSGDDVVGLLT